MPSDFRLVRDVQSGGHTPFHIVEHGETEALCGKDCTLYTYSVHNPTEAQEQTCSLCYQTFLDQYAEQHGES